MLLLVQEQDVPAVRQLLSEQWSHLVEREESSSLAGSLAADNQPAACAGCGRVAELASGLCSACGA